MFEYRYNSVMAVDLFHIRPNSDHHSWKPHLETALKNIPAVAVILEGRPGDDILATIALALAESDDVRLVAMWGPFSETLHDLVDRMALELRDVCPVTTFENDCTIEHFLWEFTFPYRGVLHVKDQDRGNLLCYVSDRDSLPESLVQALETMSNRKIQPADD
jgi:hypothetical protein